MNRVEVGGLTLAYLDWPGEGIPLLCVHALNGHKGHFAPLAERLSPPHRLLALDLRGRCDSDRPEDGYGFAYHARDIEGLADALEIEDFILVGHSFGATASVHLAALRPTRVRALVLIDGGVDPSPDTLRQMYPVVRATGNTFTSREHYLDAQRKIPFYTPWNPILEHCLCEDLEELEDGAVRSRSSAHAQVRDLDMHFWSSTWHSLPHVKCPILFLRPEMGLMGGTEQMYTDKEVARIRGLNAGCRMVTVEGGNHYTMLVAEEPPVLPPIQAFLEEVAG